MTIRYRAEHIINAGQFEHVAFWYEGDTLEEFIRARDELTNEVIQGSAIAQTAIKSQMRKAWEAGHEAGIAMVKRELGATEESTVEVPPKPSWSTPMDPKPKPWAEAKEAVKAVTVKAPPSDW